MSHAFARAPSRIIEGLRLAQLQPKGPFGKAKGKTAAQQAGLRYEKKVGQELKRQLSRGELSGALHFDWWIKFTDANGDGWARPDFFLVQPKQVLLIECKLTQNEAAEDQMQLLYAPLLHLIYQRTVRCLQVCRNLKTTPAQLIEHPAELAFDIDKHQRLAASDGCWTWQYRDLRGV